LCDSGVAVDRKAKNKFKKKKKNFKKKKNVDRRKNVEQEEGNLVASKIHITN
jgi:hypothetical protein